jgi:4-hydroxy-tetrahydrodipicolinate reductase
MRYGLVGASGRMGGEIRKVFAAHELCFALDVDGETSSGTPEVLLDFSLPGAFAKTLEVVGRFSCPLVIGTTGLSAEQLGELKTLGTSVAVVQSFNFATGVTLMKMMLREFTPLFADWDLEISETHHNKKKDAPSGTAILLRDATGRDCPMHSLRMGGVPGDHTVWFSNEGEVLSLTHRALSRSVFALGALKAAEFAVDAAPGFYTLEEVLSCGRKR